MPNQTPDHRMVEYASQEEYEEAQTQRLAAEAELAAANGVGLGDDLPGITAERRRELKLQARQRIEERLKVRRRARRLMRRAEGSS